MRIRKMMYCVHHQKIRHSDFTKPSRQSQSHGIQVHFWPNPVCLHRYNLAKQLGIATLSYEKDGFTLEPSLKYDVEKQQSHPVLAISQKKGADTLKASYDIDGEAGTLEWSRNPYKVPHNRPLLHAQ